MTSTSPAPRAVRVEKHATLGRRILSVRRVEELTPHLRRIVLSGDDLEADFPRVEMSPNDHVKVFFPHPETGELIVPQVGERGMVIDPDRPKPVFRDYTVRGFDADAGELSLDFVVHEHGVAGHWAAHARPGDQVGVIGPRGAHHYPTDYAWYLIAGDQTALPAISRWVEELPAGTRATVIVDVPTPQERLDLTGRADADVRWVHGSTTDGAADPTPLEQAVRALELPEDDDYYVWVAGEADMLKPIRRYFRHEVGLPKERLDVDGYWRRGTVNLDHHQVDDA